jgi:NAD(P)-dependent dehydrogenase (short-subunit alcohol dehydrogenase family)
MTLVNRNGIVTGSGSGLGRAVSLKLASEGATVVGVDISEEANAETVQAAKGSPGGIVPYQADVTQELLVKNFVARAEQEVGSISFFFNNAGVEGVHKRIIDTSADEWDRVMLINLRSVFLGLKYVLPAIKRAGGGAIVNTGSILSLKGATGRSDYVASKHAVIGLTRCAASEHARDGIQVNCICPGPIETPLMGRSERLVNPNDPAYERRRLQDATPMGRYGRPEEIAETVAFLLSGRAPYLTGAFFSIDGGIMTV